MSICNVHLARHCALVATDTRIAGALPGEAPKAWDAQKLYVHGSVVVAARGSHGTFGLFNVLLLHAQRLWTIEALAPRLTELCAQAHDEAKRLRDSHSPGALCAPGLDGMEVYAVGWSEALRQMHGVVATRQLMGEFRLERIESACAAPGIWPPEELPNLSTLPAMRAAARAQIVRFNEAHPGAPIGGGLVCAELTPTGIVTQTVGLS